MTRSVAADLKTELDNQSWTNLGENPKIKIGGRYGRLSGNYGVIVHEDDEDPDFIAFTGDIIVRNQDGSVEMWHKNNDDRQKMIDDVEAILLSNTATYNWEILEVKRSTEKNTLYQAYIRVKRLI